MAKGRKENFFLQWPSPINLKEEIFLAFFLDQDLPDRVVSAQHLINISTENTTVRRPYKFQDSSSFRTGSDCKHHPVRPSAKSSFHSKNTSWIPTVC